MSRYRLLPSPDQQEMLRDHCAHARFVWNLAVEQHRHWHPGRTSAPGYLEQCRQLTAARLRAREADARKDWAEKASTGIARRFDLIRVEDLQIGNMTRSARGTAGNPGRSVRAKAGLNREILRSGWGLLVRRLQDKAPGRVEKVRPHYTSQRCSTCGHVDPKSRQSQARFVCTACGFAGHADVNAAINIAAGHAVTARGGDGVTRPVNREPHLLLQSA
jgi:putative transposase